MKVILKEDLFALTSIFWKEILKIVKRRRTGEEGRGYMIEQ